MKACRAKGHYDAQALADAALASRAETTNGNSFGPTANIRGNQKDHHSCLDHEKR